MKSLDMHGIANVHASTLSTLRVAQIDIHTLGVDEDPGIEIHVCDRPETFLAQIREISGEERFVCDLGALCSEGLEGGEIAAARVDIHGTRMEQSRALPE